MSLGRNSPDGAEPPAFAITERCCSGHGEAVRLRPRNHGTIVLRRRGEALGECVHAQVFVEDWTLGVIQFAQQLGKFSLIAQRQVNSQPHGLIGVYCTRSRGFTVGHRARNASGPDPPGDGAARLRANAALFSLC